MRIKTFQGRSIEELLPEIRAELGADAVVIGQRAKVQGGVAGFFGTKVIEVTAADRMPSDDQLVDLEERLMAPADAPGAQTAAEQGDPEAVLAARFAGAMKKMGRRGGLDVVDDWDPAGDAELANEYGRVLEHAAAAGFSDLDVPVVDRSAAAPVANISPAFDPLTQAQMLAERAHHHMQGTTARLERGYAPAPNAAAAATYAPPMALPRSPGAPTREQTFAASVHDTAMQNFEPQAVATSSAAAGTVDEALRRDLGLAPRAVAPAMRSGNDIADALDAAVDMIDLKAMAALRNAMQASRRIDLQASATAVDAEVDLDLARVTEHLTRVGVDDDVVEALADTAVRHRRPFGGEQDLQTLMSEMVEETIDVRTGFPRLGRAYRAAIVGASSSGKTTMVAKLAHAYRAAGLQVGIVSIIAADPNAALMADSRFNTLDVDVQYAATPDQALHAVDALSAHDLVLIDTPGSTYLDAATFAQVQACLATIGVDDVHVVLPLATSSREARSLVDAFRPLGANRMMVSRIDESRYIGQLLNFGFRLGLPMTFLSDGPRVDSDLRAASSRDVARRILPAQNRIS